VKLLSFRNYYSFMAVYGGLTQYTVSRMKLSWKELPDDLDEHWQKLTALMNPAGNFRELRELHDGYEIPACLSPVLFVKDLTMIEEAQDNMSPPGSQLWNMTKFRMIGKALRRFYLSKSVRYEFLPIPLLQEWMLHQKGVDVKTQDFYSKINEPTLRLDDAKDSKRGTKSTPMPDGGQTSPTSGALASSRHAFSAREGQTGNSFVIHVSDGTRKSVVYNPQTILESLIERLCAARSVERSKVKLFDMDQKEITNTSVSLAELDVRELQLQLPSDAPRARSDAVTKL